MKRLLGLCLLAAVTAQGAAKAPLMISFDGKGTAMAWDIGVLQALQERLNTRSFSETYFVGSSSGSILAAYFACRGFDPGSLQVLYEAGKKFPKDLLDEETGRKSVQMMLGIPPESSLAPLYPVLDLATSGGTCVPRYPLVIAAANLDVVNGRTKQPFAGRPGREFDQGTYVLKENGKVRGKVCTYFANEPMVKILERIPPAERLCDLRPISTAAELRMAVVASISEPTYYPAVPDPLSDRSYGGGFIMNSVIQDVKRSVPETWTVGTGRPHYPRIQNRIILNWFAFPMNETLLDQRWWFDAQAPVTTALWDQLYKKECTTTEQAAMGYRFMKDCLARRNCLPKLFTEPKFSTDLSGKSLKALRHRGIDALLNLKE